MRQMDMRLVVLCCATVGCALSHVGSIFLGYGFAIFGVLLAERIPAAPR